MRLTVTLVISVLLKWFFVGQPLHGDLLYPPNYSLTMVHGSINSVYQTHNVSLSAPSW